MKALKSILAVALVLCMMLAMTACGGGDAEKPAEGQQQAGNVDNKQPVESKGERVLKIATSSLVDTFYTPKETGISEAINFAQVYDTLISLNEDGSFGPSLAETWEISDDGLTYTFHLRKDIKWHDGTPFTADDVKATFDAYHAAPMFSYLYKAHVAENIKVDDYTFAFKLKAPVADFLCNLHIPCASSVMQKKALDTYGEDYGTDVSTIVGTGPYKLTAWEPGVKMEFEANEDYFKGVPSIKNLVMNQISDINSIVVALQTGDLDLTFNSVNGSNYETLKAAPNVVLEEFPDATYHSLYMYSKSGLFADKRVRQAVAYAINKEDVLQVAQNGRGHIMNYIGDIGSIINCNPDITPDVVYEQDIEKAKALIKEAGVEGAAVEISSYASEPYISIDTYLQAVLTEIGLNATVAPVERATFLDNLDKEKVQIAPVGKVDLNYDMANSLFSACSQKFFGTAGNYGFFYNEDIEALGEEGYAEADPEKRTAIYAEMINLCAEEVPVVPLYAINAAVPHAADIQTNNCRSYSLFSYSWVK